jgi:hypothetical protein
MSAVLPPLPPASAAMPSLLGTRLQARIEIDWSVLVRHRLHSYIDDAVQTKSGAQVHLPKNMDHLYMTADALSPPEGALLRVGRSLPISGCFCGSSDAGLRFACSWRRQIKHDQYTMD